MGEVATDFSDVAKEVGKTTEKLAKALVEAPPPGQVKLGDVSPALMKYEGNDRFDFVHAASKKPDAPLRLFLCADRGGVVRRLFQDGGGGLRAGVPDAGDGEAFEADGRRLDGERSWMTEQQTEAAAEKARSTEVTDETKDAAAYFQDLDAMWKLVGVQGVQLVSKTAELCEQGAGASSRRGTVVHLESQDGAAHGSHRRGVGTEPLD